MPLSHVTSAPSNQLEWLQLVYKVPSEPSRKRTYIWRQLRGLGAVYLQDACCVLPRTADAEQALVGVATKVREFGGEAWLSVLGPAEPEWYERLVALFNQSRDEEYEEFFDTLERFEHEIAQESRKGKFTFAALEEIEDEYERLARWLARVRSRDPFGAPGGRDSDAALAHARGKLETFAEHVHQREHVKAGASDGLPVESIVGEVASPLVTGPMADAGADAALSVVGRGGVDGAEAENEPQAERWT